MTTLFAAAAMSTTAYATDYEITTSGDPNLKDAVAGDKLIIDFSGNDNSYFWAGSSTITVNADVEVIDATLHNGSSNRTYEFNGAITGDGPFYYQANKGSNTQTFVFNGDVSGYSGTLMIASNKTGTFTFNNNQTGTGAITATGASSVLNLNGATVNNSSINVSSINISGATKLAGGTAWTGNITIAAGATVSVLSDKVLDFSGATLSNAGTLNLSGATVALKSAITNSGTVTVSTETFFDLASLTATDGVYTLVSGSGTISDVWTTLTKENFLVDGHALGRGKVDVSEPGKVEVISGALALIWNGGNGTWDFETTNWLTDEGEAEVFCSGDDVTFNTANAEIAIKEKVSPNSVTIAATTTFTGEGIVLSLTPDELTIEDGATLTIDEGVTIDFGTNPDANTAVTVEQTGLQGTGTVKVVNTLGHGTTVKLGDNFNGTLDFTGNFNWASDFYSLGKDATIKLTAYSGSSVWSAKEAGNILQKVIFASDYEIGLGAHALTFSGEVDASEKILSVKGGANGNALTFAANATVGAIRQTGATINISGAVTAGQFVGTSVGATAGTLNINKGGVLTITGSSNSTAANEGSFQIAHWGATQTVNVAGTLNLTNAGISDKDGTGVINVSGEANFGQGLVVADANSNNDAIKLTLKGGGRINVGNGGITDSAILSLTLEGGTTIGALDSWTSSRALNLSGATVIDTAKMEINPTGKAAQSADGSGVDITLSGTIQGNAGSLKLVGPGSLTLSGTNSYKGGTVVSSGTLTATSSSALGSGSVTVGDNGTLIANSGLKVEGLVVSGDVQTKGTVDVDSVSILGGTVSIGGKLTAETIAVSGGKLTAESLSPSTTAKLNLSVYGEGEVVLNAKNEITSGYVVDLNGGTISGLNLTSEDDGNLLKLQAGTLGETSLGAGSLVLYADFDEENRTEGYLNNADDVKMTLSGLLNLSVGKTQIDISNLVFEDVNDKYALFKVDGVDGATIVGELNEVLGDIAGKFLLEGDIIAFRITEGADIALIWDSTNKNKAWSGTSFQGESVENFEKRVVRFGKILGNETNIENVNIFSGAAAKSLSLSAAEEDVYNLVNAGTNSKLTLGSLTVARGTLNVQTEMSVGRLEALKGTLIAGTENALVLENPEIEIAGGKLSLQNANATNATDITLKGSSTLEFVSGALDKVSSLKVAATSEDARATLHWLKGSTDDVADCASFDNHSHVEFRVDEGIVDWGNGAYASDSGNVYYKTGAGTFSLEAEQSLSGTFRVEEGVLSLGHADEMGRIFEGMIIASGANSTLLLAETNSFGTSENAVAGTVELLDGAKLLLASADIDDRQTLLNIELKLGAGTLVDSAVAETPNARGLVIGNGSLVTATGDSEITTLVQLANQTSNVFDVDTDATLTLSGAVVKSLETIDSDIVLEKTGAGTLVLSGVLSATLSDTFTDDSYGWTTTVSEGTLRFEKNTVPGTGVINVAVGANLEVAADNGGKVVFGGAVSGEGALRVVSGTAQFDAGLSGLAATVDAGARLELNGSEFSDGSVELAGELGGNGKFSGAVEFGSDAKLYAGGGQIFEFAADQIGGEHAFTKIGNGDVLLVSELANDFDVTIEGGRLGTGSNQMIESLTLAGGTLGAGNWTTTALYVEKGVSSIESELFTIDGVLGENTLHLAGELYINGNVEVNGTLNLSGAASGSLAIGSGAGNGGLLAGGRLYAETLNTSLTSIRLGETTVGDIRSELVFNDATFTNDKGIEITGTEGKISFTGTAVFAGSGKSTIAGVLNAEDAVVEVASTLEVDRLTGALTKKGSGRLNVVSASLNDVTALTAAEGQFIINNLENPDPDPDLGEINKLTQVTIVDGGMMNVQNGTLHFADEGGEFKMTGGSTYNGSLLISENSNLVLENSTIAGTLTLIGNASVDNAKIDRISLGNADTKMTGTLTVAGTSPVIEAETLSIWKELKLDDIAVNYGTLGAEFSLISYDECSLEDFGTTNSLSGGLISLDATTIDGRDIYLVLDGNRAGGALKIVAYGTLLWNGTETWDTDESNTGWKLTRVAGDLDNQAFSANRYAAFNFTGGQSITLAENVNVGGVVFDGEGSFTVNFDGGVIKDKSDGTAVAVSVQAGTVVFNDTENVSAEGVFSGGLNVRVGAMLETNRAELLGTGTVALAGTLAFTGKGSEHTLGNALTLSGLSATLNVDAQSLSLTGDVTGTSLTKTGAGTLNLNGGLAIDKLTIERGDVAVNGRGEAGVQSVVLNENAGTLVFGDGVALGENASLNLDAGKRVEFISDASNLNFVDLKDGAEVAFRTGGTFSLGGNVLAEVNAEGSAKISGDFALRGAAQDGTGFTAGATFDVASSGTLTLDGSVRDTADANAGNFLLEKSGTGTLKITGDLDSAASLRLSAGAVAVGGDINLTGDVEVVQTASLSATSGTLGANGKSLLVVDGATLTLNSAEGLSVESNLVAAGSLRVDGDVEFSGSTNVYKNIEVAANSELGIASGVTSFRGESIKLGADSEIEIDGAQLTESSGILTVDAAGTSVNLENDAQITFSSVYVTRKQTMKVAGDGEMTVLGEIEKKLTLDIAESAKVTIANTKNVQVGTFTGAGTIEKSGSGDLYILQKSDAAFTGNFVASEGSVYFYEAGALGQAKLTSDSEIIFARSAVIGNGQDAVANALVGGNGTVAVAGSGNSLSFENAIGAAFAGTLEARESGTLVYNERVASEGRNVALKNTGILSVAVLSSGQNETAEALALGTLKVSGAGNEVVLAESRTLNIGSVEISDGKTNSALVFAGSGEAKVSGAITNAGSSKGNLDLYASDDFTGTLTLSGANNAHRNTYVESGSVVLEDATAGGTGTIYLTNSEKSVVRIDVEAENLVSTTLAGTGTLEGKSGAVEKFDGFSGKLLAVDDGKFYVKKGSAAELAKSALELGAEDGATLVVTADATENELDMGKATFVGAGTVRLDLNETLTVYTANAIEGTLEVAAGTTVKVLDDGNLGTGTIALEGSAKLNLAADVLLNSEISGAGTLVKNTSGTSFVAGVINTNVSVSPGATLSLTATGENANFNLENGTLEFSQVYDSEHGEVVSRKTGTQTFDAAYVADGLARFSHDARNSNSIIDGTFEWKDGIPGTLIFVGGGTGSVFMPEISDGKIVKAGAGEWYLKNFASSASVTVENGGGVLALDSYVGDENQEIYIGRDGVLEIAGFRDGSDAVIKGKVSGAGILAVSANTDSEITFAIDGGFDWILRVDSDVSVKYGAGLSANNILLSASDGTDSNGGKLIFDVADGESLALDGKTLTVRGKSKDYLDVRNATVVKNGTGTLDLTEATVNLDGLLQIREGTVKAASFKSNPTSGVVEVQGTGTLEIGVSGETGSLAALAGAGHVRFVAGTTLIENINGAQTTEEFNSDFSGSVQIDAGATALVKSYASFGNASRINVLGTLESSQAAASSLSKLGGNGRLVINNTKSVVRTAYENNAAFTGSIEVVCGRLVMDTDTFAGLTNTVSLSASDDESGLVLSNTTGGAYALAALGEKNIGSSGTVFLASADADSGFELADGKSFGYASRTYAESGSSLTLGAASSLNGGLYVAEGATLTLESVASNGISLRAAGTNAATRNVNGDLTLAGSLFTGIPDAGTVAIHANGTATIEATALVEIDGTLLEGEEFALVSANANTIESGALFRTAAGELLSARVAENATKIVVGLATPVNELIPSGLEAIANTIFSDTGSDIYKSIYWSGTDAEQRAKLTNYSPVSFAGALELSTGLTQLENDLLRQRLEQRRYDRAYPEAEGTFKAFANVIGSSSDSSEGEDKAANYDMTHSGAVAGFDSLITYDFLVGASFTYDFGEAKVHNGGGKHETDTARVNVYGMTMLDDVSYFGFGVGFGVIGLDTKRSNALETLKGDASGTDLSFSTTLGRMFVLSAENGLHVSPYIGLDYTYSRIGGFKETGGTESALEVDDLERNSLRGTIGATLNWLPNADWRFTLEAAFRHEFLDTDAEIDAAFTGGAYAGMNASGTAYFSGEDVISVGPRVEYRINSEWAVSAGYTFESDLDNTTTHSANIGVRCKF